jgi:hypothetical protein
MPTQSTRKKRPAEDRFFAKVDKNGPIPEHCPELGPCWIWTGALSHNGYGFFKVHPKMLKAHRWSYEYHVGPIPDGLLVCHECDNPQCVNPAHLYTGTQKNNLADMTERGRAPDHAVNAHFLDKGRAVLAEHPERRARGEGHGKAKLIADDVREIRALAKARTLTRAQIAARFSVSEICVYMILNGRTWRHVE